MTSTAVEISRPAPSQATRQPSGRLRQACSLLWKAWREQRLTMALAVAVVLSVAGWVWLTLSRQPHYASTVCAGGFSAVAAGVLLGVAAASGKHRELAYLRASPVPLQSVWLAGAALGLVMAALVGLMTQSIFESLARALGAEPLASGSAIALCLSFFVSTHYFACWTKSPISAKALGLLLGGCFATVAAVGAGPNVSRWLWQVVVVIGGAALLWLGRGRFMSVARRDGQVKRREILARFMLPVVLLATLPLVANVVAVVIDIGCSIMWVCHFLMMKLIRWLSS